MTIKGIMMFAEVIEMNILKVFWVLNYKHCSVLRSWIWTEYMMDIIIGFDSIQISVAAPPPRRWSPRTCGGRCRDSPTCCPPRPCGRGCPGRAPPAARGPAWRYPPPGPAWRTRPRPVRGSCWRRARRWLRARRGSCRSSRPTRGSGTASA